MEGRKREGAEGRERGNGREGREGMKGNNGKEGKAGKGGKDGSRDRRKDGKIPDRNMMYWRRGRGRETVWSANCSVSIDRPAGRGGQLRRINIDCEFRNVVVGHGSVDIRNTTCFP